MPRNTTPHPDVADLARRAVGPLQQLWGDIASDLYESAQACGEELTTREAIESCMDANRLATTYPQYKDIDDEINALAADDYKKLTRELLKIW